MDEQHTQATGRLSVHDSGAIPPVHATRVSSNLLTGLGVLAAASWVLVAALINFDSPSTPTRDFGAGVLALLLSIVFVAAFVDYRMQARGAGLADQQATTRDDLVAEIRRMREDALGEIAAAEQAMLARVDAARESMVADIREVVRQELRATDDERADVILRTVERTLEHVQQSGEGSRARVNGSQVVGIRRGAN